MGAAKKRRDAVTQAMPAADLAPLTNPDVRAAVLALMVRKGLVRK